MSYDRIRNGQIFHKRRVHERREKWCDRKLPNIRVPPQSINFPTRATWNCVDIRSVASFSINDLRSTQNHLLLTSTNEIRWTRKR